MKTTTTAINKVYSVLKSGLSIQIFKIEKPTAKVASEYIVINSLPISNDTMQACVVNVNYHAKDIADGIPDYEKFDLTDASIISILDEYVEIGTNYDFLIDFRSQELIREEKFNEHYSNLRFDVKIINK